jgi:putative redox protein
MNASFGWCWSLSVTVRYQEGTRFEIQSRNHRIVVDQPESEDGTDQGMTPVELFVASLASCIAYYASTFLRRHIPDLAGLEVQSSWDYSDKPHRIGAMHFVIFIPHALTESEKRGLLRTVEHCTVQNTIKHDPSISIEVKA